LAQFERSLISNQSKYDKVLLGKAYFTTNELKGKKVFENNCSKCHGGNNFTTFGYENNHLDSIFNDYRFERLFLGRFRITGDSSDIGKYKIPSLRNLEFTAPFMHDGRFTTLNEVMEHYSKRFQLSISEKQSLIAFLHTLSDSAFISNSAFAKPK
jgi:cytochrome c peroxidase